MTKNLILPAEQKAVVAKYITLMIGSSIGGANLTSGRESMSTTMIGSYWEMLLLSLFKEEYDGFVPIKYYHLGNKVAEEIASNIEYVNPPWTIKLLIPFYIKIPVTVVINIFYTYRFTQVMTLVFANKDKIKESIDAAYPNTDQRNIYDTLSKDIATKIMSQLPTTEDVKQIYEIYKSLSK